MRKMQNTNVCKKHTTAARHTTRNTTTTETRRDRWHRIIEERIAEIGKKYRDLYFPAEYIEEVEGRPLADVLTERLCIERGFEIADPDYQQAVYRKADEYMERKATPRALFAHERKIAKFAVDFFLNKSIPSVGCITDEKTIRLFIHKFYHKGDWNFHEALIRAVHFAVSK